MKVSTKQFKTNSLLVEQLFLDTIHIGLLTRPFAKAPIHAYLIKNGHKFDLGTFSGNFARRDAKTEIIERYKELK